MKNRPISHVLRKFSQKILGIGSKTPITRPGIGKFAVSGRAVQRCYPTCLARGTVGPGRHTTSALVKGVRWIRCGIGNAVPAARVLISLTGAGTTLVSPFLFFVEKPAAKRYLVRMARAQVIDSDRPEVGEFIEQHWGSRIVMSRGRAFRPEKEGGFLERRDGKIAGLLTYHIDDQGMEILTLNSVLLTNELFIQHHSIDRYWHPCPTVDHARMRSGVGIGPWRCWIKDGRRVRSPASWA
jgi:hypothetical protein